MHGLFDTITAFAFGIDMGNQRRCGSVENGTESHQREVEISC